MGLYLVLYPLIYIFLTCNADERRIADGQGFVAFVKTPDNYDGIITCYVRFGQVSRVYYRYDEYEIDMTAGSSQEIITERGEIISPYSSTQCGFRISKISRSSQEMWSVLGPTYENFHLEVLTKPKYGIETNTVKEIGSGTLTCSQLGIQRSCRISNDRDLSFDKCEASVIIREPSTWYCRTLNSGTMEESKETIHVGLTKTIMPNVTVEETDVEFKLGCLLPDKNIPGCRAEYPDGQNQLFVGDYLHNERYSTAGTDLEEGYCALSIKKPIEEKEKGIWTIYQLDTSSTACALKGCLLYVGDKNNLIQQALDEEADNVRTIEVIKSSDTDDKELADDTFALTCKVPFTVDHCYLRDPSGRVYFDNEIDMHSKTLGICSFRNLPKLHGSWICGLYGEDNEKEIIRKFDIIVIPKEGEVLTNNIEALPGDSANLLCRRGMAQPITQCAFTDPCGKVYLLFNNSQDFDNSRISYYGKGLENGYCGLKIKDLKQLEFGKWICQFSGPQIKGLLNMQIRNPMSYFSL